MLADAEVAARVLGIHRHRECPNDDRVTHSRELTDRSSRATKRTPSSVSIHSILSTKPCVQQWTGDIRHDADGKVHCRHGSGSASASKKALTRLGYVLLQLLLSETGPESLSAKAQSRMGHENSSRITKYYRTFCQRMPHHAKKAHGHQKHLTDV